MEIRLTKKQLNEGVEIRIAGCKGDPKLPVLSCTLSTMRAEYNFMSGMVARTARQSY